MAELVDAPDLKSGDFIIMWVQVPLSPNVSDRVCVRVAVVFYDPFCYTCVQQYKGSMPERLNGADCNSAGLAYAGSNPARPRDIPPCFALIISI